MKYKFLTILLAVTVAFAFTSCKDSKGSSSSSDDKEITGDPEEDAEALADKAIAILEDVESEEDYEDAMKEIEDLYKEYEDYYKDQDKKELKKFERAVDKEFDRVERVASKLDRKYGGRYESSGASASGEVYYDDYPDYESPDSAVAIPEVEEVQYPEPAEPAYGY